MKASLKGQASCRPQTLLLYVSSIPNGWTHTTLPPLPCTWNEILSHARTNSDSCDVCRKELMRNNTSLKSQNERLAAENISYRISVPRLRRNLESPHPRSPLCGSRNADDSSSKQKPPSDMYVVVAEAGAVRLGSTVDQAKGAVRELIERERGWLTRDCGKLQAAFAAMGASARDKENQAEVAVRQLKESEKRIRSLEGEAAELRASNRRLEEEGHGVMAELDGLEARARKEASEAGRLKRELEKKQGLYEEMKAAFDEERESLEAAKREVNASSSFLPWPVILFSKALHFFEGFGSIDSVPLRAAPCHEFNLGPAAFQAKDALSKLGQAQGEIREAEGRLLKIQHRLKEVEGQLGEGDELAQEQRARAEEERARADQTERRLQEAEQRVGEAQELVSDMPFRLLVTLPPPRNNSASSRLAL